jgi:UDP-glucuronate 4-epimerase
MHCLVTGPAGFIGSHLCEHLLQAGHSVVGIDVFIPYYPRSIKESNLRALHSQPGFTFQELDLRGERAKNIVLSAVVDQTERNARALRMAQ